MHSWCCRSKNWNLGTCAFMHELYTVFSKVSGFIVQDLPMLFFTSTAIVKGKWNEYWLFIIQ